MHRTQKYPHLVKLPRNSVSPTGSIYKNFDIVYQTHAVSTFIGAPYVVRCSHPFILSVSVNGKVKELRSVVK